MFIPAHADKLWMYPLHYIFPPVTCDAGPYSHLWSSCLWSSPPRSPAGSTLIVFQEVILNPENWAWHQQWKPQFLHRIFRLTLFVRAKHVSPESGTPDKEFFPRTYDEVKPPFSLRTSTKSLILSSYHNLNIVLERPRQSEHKETCPLRLPPQLIGCV